MNAHAAASFACILTATAFAQTASAQTRTETPQQRDARMAWWREGRFGMFIHWGLYAIPAGEWKGKTNHAEWIRTTAQIPIDEYDKFAPRFNPVKFDADAWVKMARDAGMKYIVITSKHHDGFCLWDSPSTDFDVMSTPFKRDILAELEAACRRAGDIRFCMYHSIMDWHHPDYLPRRDWEKATRSADGASFDRYVSYLKDQLKELVTGYNPGVLWFDGEWEATWTHEYGGPLYDYVRGLNPEIIVNNRVDKGRGGMAGMTTGEHAGDFGTPEQEIPATGFPGIDWESCMTMNNNWGYNKADKNFKSTREIIRMLVDVASKGGNLLLNVGPTAEGEIPADSVQRLAEVGNWMEKNSTSIYGTHAGPFKSLPWGRATMKHSPDAAGGTLFLHVFDWPADGRLIVPGLLNVVTEASLLASDAVDFAVVNGDLVLRLPKSPPDEHVSVVAVKFVDKINVVESPTITAAHTNFIEALDVTATTATRGAEVRFTIDGSDPQPGSPVAAGPIKLKDTTTVAARVFIDGRGVGAVSRSEFTKVSPRKADLARDEAASLKAGAAFECFEGEWEKLPDFAALTPVKKGTAANVDAAARHRPERCGVRWTAYLVVPIDDVYTFYLNSDDGSIFRIGDQVVVNNDGLHGSVEKRGEIALAAGAHRITIDYFNRTGGHELTLSVSRAGEKKASVPTDWLRLAP